MIPLSCLHIHLMYPLSNDLNNWHNNSNGSVCGNWSILFSHSSLPLFGRALLPQSLPWIYQCCVCSVLAFVEPPRTHDLFPLWSQHYVPNIILLDGGVLFHHGIPSYSLVCFPLKTRGLEINDAAHQCHIGLKLLWKHALPKCALRSLKILFNIP